MKVPAWIFLILRVAAGGIFIYSGYGKLMEPSSSFAAAIAAYQIVDLRTALFLATVMPWAELIAGVFFVLGLWFELALGVLWFFNGIFIVAIISALWRRIPLENCGCFGEGAHALPVQAALALDVVLFFIFLVLFTQRKQAARVGLDHRLGN